MSVLKPAQPPPVLDKFSHLSLDAQKVMAGIYKQYQQQKDKMSQLDRKSSSQGPSKYYQNLYRIKFGHGPVQNTQSSQNSNATNNANHINGLTNSTNNQNIDDPLQNTQNHHQMTHTWIQKTSTTNACDQGGDRRLEGGQRSFDKYFTKNIKETAVRSPHVISSRETELLISGIENSSYISYDEEGAALSVQRSSQESAPLSLSPVLFPSLETVEKESNDVTPLICGSTADHSFRHSIFIFDDKRDDFAKPKEIKVNDNKVVRNNQQLSDVMEMHGEIIIPPIIDNCPENKHLHERKMSAMIHVEDINSKVQEKTVSAIVHLHIEDKEKERKTAEQTNTMCSISKRLLQHQQIRNELKETKSQSTDMKVSDHTNKRKIPSFFAPYKKQKVSDKITDNEVSQVEKNSTVVDITCLDTSQRSELLQEVQKSKEILIAVLYDDSTNQLRDNSAKKKSQSMKSKSFEQIASVVIGLTCSNTEKLQLYSMPSKIKNTDSVEWIRLFWDSLFTCSSRKICYGAKELFLILLKNIFNESKVKLGDWTVIDPRVAGWLLDPDYPPSCFEDSLNSVNLEQKKKEVIDCSELLEEDILILGKLMNRLYQKLQSRELWDLFCCVETKLVPLLALMECQQVKIDADKLMMFSNVLKKKLQKLEQKAYDSVGHSFLINSPAQLRQVLFEELKLDTKLPKKNKLAKTSIGHQISTSESVLQQLVDFHPLPGLVLEYRQFQKLKSTYMDGIMSCVQKDYLLTHWDQISAATGRLSSYQPNVQAIPKTSITVTNYKDNFIVDKEEDDTLEIFARDIFISQEGWSFLAADFQQIELRLLAHLADDEVLLQIFQKQNDSDIFVELTSQWLGKSISSITSSEREQTKRIVYSVMYGAGKEKLAEYLKISPDNAKAIMNSFLVKFPAVNQFSKKCVEFCQKHGFTSTIFKRKRMIPNIKHPSPPLRAQAERQAVNFCVQGSAADLCKAAMLQIEQSLRNHQHLRARQLYQIHDELLLEVHDDDIKAVQSILKTVMEDSSALCGSVVKLKVPVKVSISVGKTWGHMTAVK
ncbi:DNA polymerase nu [Mytilus galloprovincialis]|uniref:DNA-directed DNA polymerase n=1 Tax=Mytilus galloprovincialis TaxID=29158 RepID=A0A8B6FPL5_MYTGA|nr:DNA polymerase nu [Mytilus galloprovincialis]